MSSIAFDTHAEVKRLRQSGFDESQAEAIINAVAGATDLPDVSQLATREDVERLRLEMGQMRTELKSEIAAVQGVLSLALSKLEGDIKGQKGELVWWIIGAVGVSALLPRLPEIVGRLHG